MSESVTVPELIQKLAESGTGEQKIFTMEEIHAANPDITPEKFLVAMSERNSKGEFIHGIGDGTVRKAQLILDKKPIPVEVSRITRSAMSRTATEAQPTAFMQPQLGPQTPNSAHQPTHPPVGPVQHSPNDNKAKK